MEEPILSGNERGLTKQGREKESNEEADACDAGSETGAPALSNTCGGLNEDCQRAGAHERADDDANTCKQQETLAYFY